MHATPSQANPPFKRGDQVYVQDKTLHPRPKRRKGTIEEFIPGDPTNEDKDSRDTVQVNMAKGGRMHTLAENVTLKTQPLPPTE